MRKEGLTTRDLLKAAQYFEYDREIMFNHSYAFTFVESDGFTTPTEDLLSQQLGAKSSQYVIDSADEIPVLAEKIASDTDSSIKVAYIDIKQTLGNEIFNIVSKQVQEAIIKAGAIDSYVMSVAGRKSNSVVEEIVSL